MAEQALPAGFIPDGVAAPAAPAAAAPAGFVPDGFVPDFKSANDPVQATELAAKQRAADAAAAEAAKPGWIDLAAEAVKGWWSGMNPIPLLKSMYDGAESHFSAAEAAAKRGDYKAWLGESLHHAISPGETLVGGTIDAQRQQFQKAKKAYDAGHYSEAAAYTAAGVSPFVGPLAAKAGEDIGTGDPRQVARGFGEGVAAIRPQAGLELAGKVVRGVAGVGSAVAREVVGGAKLNPLEQASNAFAEEHGVPLDAATATGSKWARAAQKRVANSMGGEAPATEMIAAQREALARTGAKLADDVNGPGGEATKPIDAGEGVQGSIRSLITNLHDQASKAYGKVREAEAAPANRDTVPLEAAPVDAIPDWQKRQLRRIVHEMDASGFNKATWNDLSEQYGPKDGNAGGGQYERVPGSGGAKVYHDIQEHGGAGLDRGDLQHELEVYLGGGNETAAVKGALKVAEGRYRGNRSLSTPELPPSTFDMPTRYEGARERSGQMAMAVDLTDVKKALAPIRDRMAAGANIAPLMGAKAEAFRALQRIVEGPDHAPLSVVDEALSDLKAMARGGKNGPALPELRSAGQGTAAYAVQRLEAQVRARAAQAGPHVLQALEEGRAATREKATTGQLFETLREEPVQAFEQLTAPADKGVRLLEKIRDVAPMQMQDVGRAWLEKQLDLANQEGGFGHADKMWSNWNALGKQTKQILFSGAGQTQALDRFFLLAKRIAENPNPSGTAHTLTALNVGSSLLMNRLAKLLYTKQGVDAISRWMSADVPTRGASAGAGAGRGARAAAWMGVRAAAAKAGLQLPATQPALAADADEQR